MREISGAQQLVAYVSPKLASAAPSLAELRTHLRERLPGAAAPALVIVPALPLTLNGKLDVRALPLPEARTEASSAPAQHAHASLRAHVADAFARALGVAQVQTDQDFFASGGSSLQGLALLDALSRAHGITLRPSDLLVASTPAALAARIERAGTQPSLPEGFVWLRHGRGSEAPVQVFIPGGTDAESRAALRIARVAPLLGTERDMLAVLAPVIDVASVEAIATHVIGVLLARFPGRAFTLTGDCVGGLVAFEATRQLRARGERVDALLLVDTVRPSAIAERRFRARNVPLSLGGKLPLYFLDRVEFHGKQLLDLPWRERAEYLKAPLRTLGKLTQHGASVLPAGREERAATPSPLSAASVRYGLAVKSYRPQPLSGALTLVHSADFLGSDWSDVARDGVTLRVLPDAHADYFSSGIERTAAVLRELLP